jgi:hypothetical protein
MKKSKKANIIFKNKIKGLRLGDRVFIHYLTDYGVIGKDGIVEDIGKDYIVIDKYLINDFELINLNKI